MPGTNMPVISGRLDCAGERDSSQSDEGVLIHLGNRGDGIEREDRPPSMFGPAGNWKLVQKRKPPPGCPEPGVSTG